MSRDSARAQKLDSNADVHCTSPRTAFSPTGHIMSERTLINVEIFWPGSVDSAFINKDAYDNGDV